MQCAAELMTGEMQATGLQQVIYSVLILSLLLLQLPIDNTDKL
jgi:hypothetical protein